MKNLVLLISTLLFSYSLMSQEDNYKIYIELDSLPEGTLIFVGHNDSNGFRKKAKRLKSGVYEGQNLDETSFIGVVLADSTAREWNKLIPLFISNNDEVTVSGTMNNYTVTGSETQDVFEKHRKLVKKYNDIRGETNIELYRMALEGVDDSAYYKRLSKKNHEAIVKIDSLTKVFVRQNLNSLTAVFLLNGIKTKYPLDTIRELFSRIPEKYHNHSSGKDLDLYTSINPLERGDTWVNFTSTDTSGNKVRFCQLKAIEDKFVLLLFSTPGCQPCEWSIPELKKVYNKYHEKVELVTYITQSNAFSMMSQISEKNIPWTYLSNEKEDKSTRYKYGAYAVPHYVLISPDRKILFKIMGYKEGQILAKMAEHMN